MARTYPTIRGGAGTGPWAELVAVPEWGGAAVEVRSVPALDRLQYMGRLSWWQANGGVTDFRELWPDLLIAACHAPVKDERGRWLPGEGPRLWRHDDRARVLGLRADTLDALFGPAARLAGLDQEHYKDVAWRLMSDNELRFVLDICWEHHISLSEFNERFPSWEVALWANYWDLKSAERRMEDQKRSGRQAVEAGASFGAPPPPD